MSFSKLVVVVQLCITVSLRTLVIPSSSTTQFAWAWFSNTLPPTLSTTTTTTVTTTQLFAIPHSSSSSPNNNNNKKSARDQERRQEEQRRRQRAKDVIIGQTSAIPGSTNYPLNIEQTEQEWMQYATSDEKYIYQYTEKGIESMKMLRLEDAIHAFQCVFTKKPNAYLWQAGIVWYYLQNYTAAANCLAQCAQIYETKFQQPATEERIWWYACYFQTYYSNPPQSENEFNNHTNTTIVSSSTTSSTSQSSSSSMTMSSWTPLPYKQGITETLLASETRKVVKLAHALFHATLNGTNPLQIIILRAQLRSMAGPSLTLLQSSSSSSSSYNNNNKQQDPKLWKLHAWYYLGLYYDAIQDNIKAKHCMKCALLLASGGNGSDIIHILPMLHMSQRNWFDDNDNEEWMEFMSYNTTTKQQQPKIGSSVFSSSMKIDPYYVQSLVSGLEEMRYYDLRDALRNKGLPSSGSKAELVQKLLQSILSETETIL